MGSGYAEANSCTYMQSKQPFGIQGQTEAGHCHFCSSHTHTHHCHDATQHYFDAGFKESSPQEQNYCNCPRGFALRSGDFCTCNAMHHFRNELTIPLKRSLAVGSVFCFPNRPLQLILSAFEREPEIALSHLDKGLLPAGLSQIVAGSSSCAASSTAHWH